jgi:hypothetical protein
MSRLAESSWQMVGGNKLKQFSVIKTPYAKRHMLNAILGGIY